MKACREESGRAWPVILIVIAVPTVIAAAVGSFVAHSVVGFAKEKARAKVTESETFEKTIPLDGALALRARVKVGSLRVKADSLDGVQVRAVRHADGPDSETARRLIRETKVTLEREGDTIVLEDVVPERIGAWETARYSIRLDVEIHVPAGLRQELNTGVGDVRFEGRAADVSAHSGVGDVKVSGQVGNLDIHSGVGNVAGVAVECAGDTAKANAGTGNITLELDRLPSRATKVNVGVGDVTLTLPEEAKASVNMKTGVGGVQSAFSLQKQGRNFVGGHLSGDINGGGAQIEINAGTGNASLKKR